MYTQQQATFPNFSNSSDSKVKVKVKGPNMFYMHTYICICIYAVILETLVIPHISVQISTHISRKETERKRKGNRKETARTVEPVTTNICGGNISPQPEIILKSLTCKIPLRGCFFCGGELSRQICVNTSPRQTCFVCRIFHKKKHLVGLESMTKFSLPGQN